MGTVAPLSGILHFGSQHPHQSRRHTENHRRVSAAIEPHYDRIGELARKSEVNHIDETSFTKKGVLQWLWVMTNATVAFFLIHANRSKKAF